VFGNNIPKEVRFFAKNLRTEDLAKASLKDQFSDVVESYMRVGLKSQYMDEPYRAARETLMRLTKEGKVTQPEVMQRLFLYLQQAVGIDSDLLSGLMMEASRQGSKQVFDKLRKLGAKVPQNRTVDDVIGAFQGLTVGSLMSWRPWPIIRDSFQPWITLAPRVGMDMVSDAMDQINKHGDEIANRMRRAGKFQETAAELQLQAGTNRGGFMSWFNRVGMKFFRHANERNRMVADQVATIAMRDGSKRFFRGEIDEKQFMRMSGMAGLDDAEKRTILSALTDESWERARDLLSDALIRETQFPYRHGTNPLIFNGLFGRMFGMFGHYPVYFADNVLKNMRNLPTTDKIAFAARTATIGAGLGFVFNDVLGIRTDDFNPAKSMIFTGGPYFDMIQQGLQLADPYNWGTGQAKRMVNDAQKILIPGYYAGRGIVKGSQSLAEGDIYRGLLELSSVSLNEDWKPMWDMQIADDFN